MEAVEPALLAQQLEQLLQAVAHVAHDGNVHVHRLADRRRVDVDVDLARVLAELVELARHAVVETRADGDQHVALVHRQVGAVGAVHAEHAQRHRVIAGDAADSHQRVGGGNLQRLDELAQLLARPGQDRAASEVDHGPLGLEDQRQGLLDLPPVALVARLVVLEMNALRVVELALRVGDVLGDVHQHRVRDARWWRCGTPP